MPVIDLSLSLLYMKFSTRSTPSAAESAQSTSWVEQPSSSIASGRADLADYAEREAGSQSPRVSSKAEAGPSGGADGQAEELTAVAATSAGGHPQPSASTPPTKVLVDRWTEQLLDKHRCGQRQGIREKIVHLCTCC